MAGGSGNTRISGAEQFYTPAPLAAMLLDATITTLDEPASHFTWLEPAGGTGAFCAALDARGLTWVSYDTEPLYPGIVKGDFLTTAAVSGPVVVVGNPPFGRCHSLSIPFFNHAALSADTIAFVVPCSWRKWSVINRLDRSFHLKTDIDVAVNFVDAAGVTINSAGRLHTIFQVWVRRDEPRPLFGAVDRGYVTKVKAPADADVALTVCGHGVGTVRTTFETVAKTTQMYLKLDPARPDAVLDALKVLNYRLFADNVAYTPALALPELHALLNDHFDSRDAART